MCLCRVHAMQSLADYMTDRALQFRRGLEMLMRKLLNLPSRPAVLMLNLWMPGFNRYSYWEVH